MLTLHACLNNFSFSCRLPRLFFKEFFGTRQLPARRQLFLTEGGIHLGLITIVPPLWFRRFRPRARFLLARISIHILTCAHVLLTRVFVGVTTIPDPRSSDSMYNRNVTSAYNDTSGYGVIGRQALEPRDRLNIVS